MTSSKSGEKAVKLFLVSLLLLSITAFLPIINASGYGNAVWYQNGNWTSLGDISDGTGATDANIQNGTYGIIRWVQTVNTFSSYKASFNLNATAIARQTWVPLSDELGTGRLRIILALGLFNQNGDNLGVAWINQYVKNDFLGQQSEVGYGSHEQFHAYRGSAGLGFFGGEQIGIYNLYTFQINAYAQNTTVKTVLGKYDPEATSIAGLVSTDVFSFQETATEVFNTNAFNQTVQLRLYLAYTESGTFNIAQFAEDIRNDGTYTPEVGDTGNLEPTNNPEGNNDILSAIGNFVGSITSGAMSALSGIANFVNIGLSFAWTVLTAIGGMLTGLVPYLPVLFIFYLLDALFRSLHEGSIQPIGYFLQGIITLVFTIGTFIISTGQTVWDILTFWN